MLSEMRGRIYGWGGDPRVVYLGTTHDHATSQRHTYKGASSGRSRLGTPMRPSARPWPRRVQGGRNESSALRRAGAHSTAYIIELA